MLRIAFVVWSTLPCALALAEDQAEVGIALCKSFSLEGGKVEFVWCGRPIEVKTLVVTDFSKSIGVLPGGKYHVFFTPKGGMKVKAIHEWIPKARRYTIQLADHLGTTVVLGDNLPRVESILLTEETDPGPGEKGHRPIQRVSYYKEDLIVPPGFYSVWIVPTNGAKAQRIANRIRVLAGRETRVGE